MLSSAAARSSATLFRRVVADTVSRRFVARHVSTLPSASAAVPSVKDMMIKLTIVDPSGARKQITGLVGKTLYEAFEMQGIDIGPSSGGAKPETPRTESWMEPTFGEGPTSGYDHVVLTGRGADKVQRLNYTEQQQLDDYWDWDEIYENSRLASVVTLTKDMDGMVVYVPDRIVDDCP